jgi:hypothetical protein
MIDSQVSPYVSKTVDFFFKQSRFIRQESGIDGPGRNTGYDGEIQVRVMASQRPQQTHLVRRPGASAAHYETQVSTV